MQFIPRFHFDNPDDKLKSEWCKKVIDYYFYNSNNVSLLKGKNVKEIEEYASGDFDMTPFKLMFKSMRKKLNAQTKSPDGSMSPWAQNINTIGVEFKPLALIPIKLNSAINNIMRVPVDPVVTAQDALAMRKKKEDIEFLKNKPRIEEDLQEFADDMGIGPVDIGTTKHSSVKFSAPPLGLDLNNPEQEETFAKLFYSLQVTTAFEKVLKQFHSLKGTDDVRLLNIEDDLKYGVSVCRGYESAMTGLPDVDYIYPATISAPESDLPDCNDHTHRIQEIWMTVMEMFNFFSNEICDEETLDEIINGKGKSYCGCGKNTDVSSVSPKNWSTFRVNFKYVEVKSVDWVGVKQKSRSKRGVYGFTTDEKECTEKIWGQNTYGFYWLANTDYFFGIHRLPGTHRTKGKEAFQNFSTHIYKSQKKSAVELSISENKKAQIAELKLQHTLIKSLPPGKYVDLKFLRGALEGLTDENNKYTMDDLLSGIFEHNMMIGDTGEFDGKNDGQLKPFIDIPGGLKDEARGYMQVIASASYNIASITGINEQLTGQSAEELVGLQQLRINSGLNAIDYCNRSTKNKFEALNNNWVNHIQRAIEAGGKLKKAIIDMIGDVDADLIDSLDEAPLHELTARVDVGNRYNELQTYQVQLNFLKQKGVVSTVDEYLLSAIDNPKERFQKLYYIEHRWKQEQDRIRQEQIAAAQGMEQARGQNQLQVTQAEGQQDIQKEYAKGDVQQKLMQLGSQLGMSQQQMDSLLKRALQKERNEGQTQKQLAALREKANLEIQKAYV